MVFVIAAVVVVIIVVDYDDNDVVISSHFVLISVVVFVDNDKIHICVLCYMCYYKCMFVRCCFLLFSNLSNIPSPFNYIFTS